MLTDIDSTTVYSWCRCRFGYGYRDTSIDIHIQESGYEYVKHIYIIYIHTHLCILLKCARVSFDIYYLPTFPVVPSQIVHDIDVYHVGCYIHATWYVVLDVKSVLHLLRCIGTRCLQKGVLHWCASAPTQWALLCPIVINSVRSVFWVSLSPKKKGW